MSVGRFLQQAAAGAGEAIYVDDLFSTHIDYSDSWGPHTATTGLDMSGEGGMVWTKPRGSGNHWLYDTERGATKALSPDQTAAEATVSLGLKSFTSTGFTFDLSHVDATNGQAWWSFRKQPGFFDVVTYTGDGTSGRTVNHNLDSVPGMMIVKRTSANEKWAVYHRSADASAPEDKYLVLNSYGILADNDNIWNDTAPTSTQFTVGSDAMVNGNGDSYVAYLFAHDEQDFGTDSDEAIIKCGSYSGNSGSQTIDVGFEAQWVLIKNTTSGSTDWFLVDVMRGIADTTAVDAALIRPNDSAAEQTSGAGGARITARNTGFGFLSESNLSCNRSGETYVYVAIRRPHKPASKFAATDLFSMDAAGSTSSNPCFVSNNHIVDMAWEKQEEANTASLIFSRITGPKYLNTTSTSSESTGSSVTWDYMSGCLDGFGGADTYQSWMFRRAPGFFDVTAHTSNGQPTQQITHNLGVAPEMAWIKIRSTTGGWFVYHKDLSAGKNCFLDTNAAETTSNTTTAATFTSTYWTPGDDGYYSGGSNNQTYIAYLFASVSGISKVGSYSGTGSDVNVDCGFSAGARFVLIKRSDSTGDWYYYDSVRGIVAGNDPYLLLNTTAAQVTNTDYIDPLSSGFTITSSAPAALNASGGTYVFYAIA